MKHSITFVGAALMLATSATAQTSATVATTAPLQRTSLAPHSQAHAPHGGAHGTGHNVRVERKKPRPMIGVRIAPVDSAVSAQLPEDAMPALILTSIFKDSPAARAGLQVNDVVTAVNGNSNVTVDTLIETISSQKPGSTVTLDISRAGTHRVFNVTVEEIETPVFDRIAPDGSQHNQWLLKPGTHTWPRFGVAPEGQIMVQRDEDGAWVETDATTDFLDTYNNAIHEYHGALNSQNGYLDLTQPEVDPDGNLRRQIEHLHTIYSNPAGAHHGTGLEQRIQKLETKVDEIHGMLSELLRRTK